MAHVHPSTSMKSPAEFADILKQSDLIERTSSIVPVFAKPPPHKQRPGSRPTTAADRAMLVNRTSTKAVDGPSPEPFSRGPTPETRTPTPTLRPPSYQYKGRGALSIGGVATPAFQSPHFGDPSMEATRLDGSMQRAFRPGSAGRPSTAPVRTKVFGGRFARRVSVPGNAIAGAPAQDATRRPCTAPAEGSSILSARASGQDQLPPRPLSSLEIQGEQEVEDDGYMPLPDSFADEDLYTGFDQVAKDAVADALPRVARLDTSTLGDLPEVRQLRRGIWDPVVFQRLRDKVLQVGDHHGLHLLKRLVVRSTDQAMERMSYDRCPDPKVRDDHGATVDLSSFLSSAPLTQWYGDIDSHVSWDMNYENKKDQANAVVTDLNPLDVAQYSCKVFDGHPVVVVIEVNSFDELGDIDRKCLSSLAPDDLLLRTDFGRYLDRIKQECRENNQKLSYPDCSVKDYLQNPDQPFIIRCPEVILLRGPQESGFAFEKEPQKIEVLIMSMSSRRPKIATVQYRNKGKGEWYENLPEYNALASRLHIIAHVCHTQIAKHAGAKPVLVMAVPGSAGHYAQPHESVISCVKHWKQTFGHQCHCIQLCARTHYGGNPAEAGKLRRVVDLKERPPPGLELNLRAGGGRKTKKRRLQGNVSVLSDPSDEEYAVDDAVQMARATALHKNDVSGKPVRGNGDDWREDQINNFMKTQKYLHKSIQDAKDADGEQVDDHWGKRNSSPSALGGGVQASGMAEVAERVNKADLFGKIDDVCIAADDGRPAIYGPAPPMFAVSKAPTSNQNSAARSAAVPAPRARSDSDGSFGGFGENSDNEELSQLRRLRMEESAARTASKDSSFSFSEEIDTEPRTGNARFARSQTVAEGHNEAAGSKEEELVRRASTGNMGDYKKYNTEEMGTKVGEMKDLARKGIVAKANHVKLLKDIKRNQDVFDHRRKSSFQGQMGAGGEYHVFHGGDVGQQMSQKDINCAKKDKGNNARPALTGFSGDKQAFVSDESLANRMELRNRLRRGSIEREKEQEERGMRKSTSFRPTPDTTPIGFALQDDEADEEADAKETPTEPERKAEVPGRDTGHRVARYMRYLKQSTKALPEDMAEPPRDRPFASLETQFRRRTQRDAVKVYRAGAETNLTTSGLREIELATAESEGAILKLLEKVVAIQNKAYEEGGDGLKKPWQTMAARNSEQWHSGVSE